MFYSVSKGLWCVNEVRVAAYTEEAVWMSHKAFVRIGTKYENTCADSSLHLAGSQARCSNKSMRLSHRFSYSLEGIVCCIYFKCCHLCGPSCCSVLEFLWSCSLQRVPELSFVLCL